MDQPENRSLCARSAAFEVTDGQHLLFVSGWPLVHLVRARGFEEQLHKDRPTATLGVLSKFGQLQALSVPVLGRVVSLLRGSVFSKHESKIERASFYSLHEIVYSHGISAHS